MRLIIFAALAAVSACSVSAPVTGSMATGEPVTGVAAASMSSGGTVEVQSDGMICRGTYDAFSPAPLLSVPLACDDGVTGMAQVERSEDLMSGAGTFELSDGRSGTFTYAVE